MGVAKTWMGKKIGERQFGRTGSVLRLDFFAHTYFCPTSVALSGLFAV
jgi:hypothetical protein